MNNDQQANSEGDVVNVPKSVTDSDPVSPSKMTKQERIFEITEENTARGVSGVPTNALGSQGLQSANPVGSPLAPDNA